MAADGRCVSEEPADAARYETEKDSDTAEHNIASLLILAACLAVITFAMEIFVFNSTYQSIPADERGVRQIGGNQVTLNNISENNDVYTLDRTERFVYDNHGSVR